MDTQTYQDTAGLTAIYPGTGTGSLLAVAYTGLGLAGEAAELMKALKLERAWLKRDQRGQEEVQRPPATVVSEMGDVCWYVSRVRAELNIAALDPEPFDSYMSDTFVVKQVIAWAGVVAEQCKKHIRDGAKDERTAVIVEALCAIEGLLASMAHNRGLCLDEVKVLSIHKLSNRKKSGTLQGDGDRR